MRIILPFIIGIAIMLVLMIKTKMGPFMAMLFASLIIGIGSGLEATETIDTIVAGFGSTCQSIGIVIIFGTILGQYLEKSNATQRIATSMLKLTGDKNADVALGATGFIVSIPVFSDVALIMLSPIAKAVSKKSGVILAPLATVLALSLLATNAFVAPTPAPLAAVAVLGIDVGESIMWGLAGAAVITIAGWIFCRFFLAKKPESWYTYSEEIGNTGAYDVKEVSESEMPSFFQAVLPILVPIILIIGSTVSAMVLPEESQLFTYIDFVGNKNIALVFGIITAILLLKKFLPTGEVFTAMTSALTTAGPVIFITAAGGTLAKVVDATGVGALFADFLAASPLPVVLVPFLICGLSKFTQGSGAVAMLMASTLTVPLIQVGLISGPVAFLAICSGSLFLAHVNNSFFWVFANLFGYDTKTGLKTLMIGNQVQALAGLAFCFILNIFM